MKKIDPTQPLSQDDFCELFEQVPLNEEERKDIKEIYWGIYQVCLSNTCSIEVKKKFLEAAEQQGILL